MPPSVRGPPARASQEADVADERQIPIKIPEHILRAVYANQMVVRHTREEFVLDFLNFFPPEAIVNARVIVSPGHVKRMIRALQENLARYEARFGPLVESEPPSSDFEKN